VFDRPYDTLLVDGPDADGVLFVTLNRPDRGNAATFEMYRELGGIMRALRAPVDEVGAVVITGAGQMFCAGGDMEMIQTFGDPAVSLRVMEEGAHFAKDLLSVRCPVVAAVNGHAMGFGASLALFCDVVIMSEDARFADPHVKAGIVAGDGGALMWPLLVGPNRAKEYLMTGDPLDGPTAYQLGLVNHIVPAAEVLPKAMELARRLATGPRHAIAWTKQAVNLPILQQALTTMTLGNAQEARAMATADMVEGTTAFLERRAPQWPSVARKTAPSNGT
jgi:enoyl-CoA hydratase